MKLIYWHAFPIERGGKGYYRYVWKLFGKNGVPVWFWDQLDPNALR